MGSIYPPYGRALIMTHSDDNGLVLPPHIAPHPGSDNPHLQERRPAQPPSRHMSTPSSTVCASSASVSKYDDAENRRPGFKFADYELKGIPVRLAIGARDIEEGTVEIMRRDTLEKHSAPLEGIAEYVATLLEEIQQGYLQQGTPPPREMTRPVDTWEEFKTEIEKGGFCSHTGTEQPRLKRKSRKRQRPPYAVSPSTATPLPALVSTPASLRHAV